MTDQFFTHATYRVKPENDQKFQDAWKHMTDVFQTLPSPPLWGRLLRNTEDRTLYFAIGAWQSERAIEATRTLPSAVDAINNVRALCTQMDRVICRQLQEITSEHHVG